jgi:hypothetical protein
LSDNWLSLPPSFLVLAVIKGHRLFLLYADESGNPSGSDQNHFILAGVSVFERRSHWLSMELDKIAARFSASYPFSVELHGNPMFAGRKFWRQFPKQQRTDAIKDALALIDGKHYRIFASVVNKVSISPEDPVRSTFQQLITRFDHFLTREHTHFNNTHRGLVIFDKTSKESSIQSLARDFKTMGHDWGSLRNMAEVPAFIDSEATRLIQLADLVAYALFRKAMFP